MMNFIRNLMSFLKRTKENSKKLERLMDLAFDDKEISKEDA